MLSRKIRVLNFDDSLMGQRGFLRAYDPRIVDLRRFGLAGRIWLDRSTAEEIYKTFDPGLRDCPTFVGSGDFHHISSLLIRQFEQPLTVIVFDHHPDWDIMPPSLACASWTTHLLKRANIKKLILIGISSEDISTRIINTGNLKALAKDRLEIYPYRHRDTKVLLRQVPSNISIKVKGYFPYSTIQWRELFREDLLAALNDIIDRVETRDVYISLDKDCLTAEHAMTNWEEGSLALKDVLQMIRMIRQRCAVVGLDVVGDYSKPLLDDIVKEMYIHFDRHKDYTARGQPLEMINSINERANMEIVKALSA